MVLFLKFLERLLWISSMLFTAYTIYYVFFLPFSFTRKQKYKKYSPKCRFAVLVAARNEQDVISNLVESLLKQNYPKELYDIIVIPNNCTDNTEEVARKAGAKILFCEKPVRTKGDVLEQIVENLINENKYDAICVFDADNVVDCNFLKSMNNAWCSGSKVAQGFRDSKNPKDNCISSSYSIYYWMVNRFYSHARSKIGLSAMINGSGFMADLSFLNSMGGWKTKTMTEDIEFTIKCVLKNMSVSWVPEAITYDEQPLTFTQSWRQRSRWTTGVYQCLCYYSLPLLKGMFCGNFKDFRLCIDYLLFLLAPLFQFIWVFKISAGHIIRAIAEHYHIVLLTPTFSRIFLSLLISIIISCIMSVIVIILEKKSLFSMSVGIISYWFFIMSWLPINFICLFCKTKEWKSISHTRSLSVNDVK